MDYRIMTLQELYNFCLTQNFSHFNAEETDTEIVVQYNASVGFSETDDKYKEGLIPFTADAYHDHINLNNSEILTETLEETLPSAQLRPVLASIVVDEETGEKDFGSHDFVIEEDENGEERYRYIEQPVGVVFGNNTIVPDEDAGVNRARLHGFLYEGYCQDAIDIIQARGGKVDCSVELHIREMSFNAKDKVLTLEDFFVSGLTLLGASVKPGMANSNVTISDFSVKKFSRDDSKLVEILEKLNETLSKFNIDNDSGKEEPQLEDIVLQEETPVIDEQDEVIEETPVEDIDSIEENEVADNNKEPKPEKFSIVMSDGSEKTFQLSLSDIQYALNSLVNDTYSEADNCWYAVTVFEDQTVVMQDYWTGKAYRQSYTRDENNFALSGERVEVFANWLTEQEESALAELRSNFESVSTKLDQYVQAENAQRKEDILNSEDYAVIRDSEEFEQIIANVDSYDVSEVQAKCDALLLSYAKQNFAVKGEPQRGIKIKTGIREPEYKPYGSLFN